MPAMASRTGSRRRSMNEINMVPFIDVMLVLLIIFMVTAHADAQRHQRSRWAYMSPMFAVIVKQDGSLNSNR